MKKIIMTMTTAALLSSCGLYKATNARPTFRLTVCTAATTLKAATHWA